MSSTTTLVLGTAMWGWTTPPARCFALLDRFYEAGGRDVDTATNYPINKVPADFRRAESILLEWLHATGVQDLRVMMKVGSLHNLRTPDNNLSKSFLLFVLDDYQQHFGSNLDTFMLHWDDREDAAAVADTIAALSIAYQRGLRPGLSGIRHPAVYAELLTETPLPWRIQCKHNLLHSDYARYAPLHDVGDFLAYGTNAGGLKLDTTAYRTDASLLARGGTITADAITSTIQRAIQQQPASARPPVTTMNHCGLIFTHYWPGITGLITGPSQTEQLTDTLNWIDYLTRYDYQDWYRLLLDLYQQGQTPKTSD